MQEKIIAAVARFLEVNAEQLKSEKTLASLDLDSLGQVELILFLEEEFDVEVSEEDGEKWRTIGDAVECVQRLVEAK